MHKLVHKVQKANLYLETEALRGLTTVGVALGPCFQLPCRHTAGMAPGLCSQPPR